MCMALFELVQTLTIGRIILLNVIQTEPVISVIFSNIFTLVISADNICETWLGKNEGVSLPGYMSYSFL
jgi:hypothetical protein